MSLQDEIKFELLNQGAEFVHFVDASQLPESQTKGFSNAILIGMVLSPGFIQKITNTPDYVQQMIRNNQINDDEFSLKEKKTDWLADYISNYLKEKGYDAYAQSEDNISSSGYYNEQTKSTPLPHKTIATQAGLGWIGNHNLLVTEEFGSAISMCTVLTDAPFKSDSYPSLNSKCGDCKICRDLCPVSAIRGNTWTINTSRDELVDVNACTTCLVCMALCPWTQKYLIKNLKTT